MWVYLEMLSFIYVVYLPPVCCYVAILGWPVGKNDYVTAVPEECSASVFCRCNHAVAETLYTSVHRVFYLCESGDVYESSVSCPSP